MPTLPLYSATPVNATPSTTNTGTALVTEQFQPTAGDRALMQGAINMYQTREAMKRAEQQQFVTSRALALQNQLKAVELEAASTTGTADEYLAKVKESSDSLWMSAYEGLNAEQSRALAPKIEALQSAHNFSITERELFKRADSGRAALMAQERDALNVFRSPDSNPADRFIAQSNYFEGLDEAVTAGLYSAVDAETIKTTFAESATKLNTAAAKDAFVAAHADRLMAQYSDPNTRLRAVSATEGPPDFVQALRDEVEDRTSRENRYNNEKEADYAGQVMADILVNPGNYSVQKLKESSGVAGRFAPDLIKLYKTVRDEGTAPKDDPAVVGGIFSAIREMTPEQLATHNFIPQFYNVAGELAVTGSTISRVNAMQSSARAGSVAAELKKLDRSWGKGMAIAGEKGLSGQEQLDFAATYSNAVLNLDEPPKTPLEEKQLGDDIARELEVDLPMRPWDLEDPVYQMTAEELNSTLEYGDLEEGWPDYWHARVLDSLARELQAEDDGLDFNGALQRAEDLKKNSPEIYRKKAKTFLAPLFDSAVVE